MTTNQHDPVTLAGPVDVLLSHMALLGTALLVDEALGEGTARIRWTDEADPRPQLCGEGVTPDVVGRIVSEHARAVISDSDGWLHAVDPQVGSLFGARTGQAKLPATDDEWRRLQGERDRAARDLRGLNSALLLGLGERAWWLKDHKKHRPDHGASAWEMRTRNKGMEFLPDTLIPVGRAVAARDVSEVTSGLVGETLRDEPGKNKPDSRTATGLAPLGPADAARVWAGLWALAALPVWAVPTDRSLSSACRPARGPVKAQLLMPVPTSWVTVGRMRAALRSRQLVLTVASQDEELLTSLQAGAALTSVRSWGFSEVFRFPVIVSGSASAPERRALGGEAVA